MKKSFPKIISVIILIMAVFTPIHSLAYPINNTSPLSAPSLIDPLNILKSDLFKNSLPGFGNFNIGTTIPSFNLNLLNTNNLSSTDLTSALKAVLVLAINLFLIVIQTVVAILKALLPFLQ